MKQKVRSIAREYETGGAQEKTKPGVRQRRYCIGDTGIQEQAERDRRSGLLVMMMATVAASMTAYATE
jgi:hypothetical protein